MPDVSGASAVNTRVHTQLPQRTRGCGCIGHPAFPAPSGEQKAGNSRSNLAQTCGEIAKLCFPSLRGALATKQSILSSGWHGLLRGACHRARIRATRWLAMTRIASVGWAKGALAPCPPSIGSLILNGGHASLLPTLRTTEAWQRFRYLRAFVQDASQPGAVPIPRSGREPCRIRAVRETGRRYPSPGRPRAPRNSEGM